ncbi:hypothetical protein [Deinococcus ruber]|uniref:Uncharacterized protein n=1 Tax=Deinococcus ruber TaxID=1848197 RepID=A0A918FDX4_9DEIO|nr:hypothetical protein [Deinococcus ruber]GGR25988.1 hypothetical protein GCM10008957_42040 [Deinococcus ruber]
MSRKIRNSQKEVDSYPSSGRGFVHVCPHCGRSMELCDTRDGDQAYFCHVCQKGHRAGSPPLLAFRPEEAS